MQLELRSIKVLQRASEETYCYEARLFRDGKHIAFVSNDGHGGGDRVLPVGAMTHDGIREIDRHLAATLPPITGYGMTIPQSLETWCAEQVERHLQRKEYLRAASRAILFVTPALPGVRQMTGGSRTREEVEREVLRRYPDATLFSRLPESEAIDLFFRAARPQEAR